MLAIRDLKRDFMKERKQKHTYTAQAPKRVFSVFSLCCRAYCLAEALKKGCLLKGGPFFYQSRPWLYKPSTKIGLACQPLV